MSSRARTRRSSERDEEDEGEAASSRQITPVSEDERPRKRGRLTNGSLQAQKNGKLLPDSYLSNAEVDKHMPGAIVRIKLNNFVTYTSAEFHCGPSLNMIIGPNGTGKSTLVCAICLGLGWSPNCLGRAKQVGEFVKHGAPQAHLEIELAGGPRTGGRNQIIKRTIQKEGNKSSWMINGRQSNQKEVQKLAMSFKIQIDNLCQFLPQDRVVEFAALSPVQLLESTQRAAAEEQMTVWHQELKDIASQRATRRNEQKTDQDKLTELQARQNQQRAEVERMNERRDLQEKLTSLHKARIPVQERMARIEEAEKRAELQAARTELAQLQQDQAPVVQKIDAKKAYHGRVEEYAGRLRRQMHNHATNATRLRRELDAFADDFKEIENQLNTEERHKNNQKSEVKRLELQIRTLEGQLQSAPPEVDLDDFRRRTKAVDDEKRAVAREAQEHDSHMQALKTQSQMKGQEQRDLEAQLKGLRTQSGQQLQKLKNNAPDAFRAWEWIKDKKDRFEGRVYGPPAVECSVENPRYADALETILGNSDVLKVFTVTSSRDYRVLSSHLFTQRHKDVFIKADPRSGLTDDYSPGEKGLGLKDVNIRNIVKGLDSWQTPCDKEELRSYGLDDWALGCLQGPAPVLSMLCESNRLHKTAVSLEPLSNEQYHRVARPESGITTWIAGNEGYSITRRAEYGPGAESTSVTAVKAAKIWTDKATGDSGLEAELRSQWQQLKGELEEMKTEFQETKAKLQSSKEQLAEFETRRNEIQKEKQEKQKARGQFDMLPGKIDSLKEKLRDAQKSIIRSEEDKRQLRDREGEQALKRGQKALDYSRAVDALRQSHVDSVEADVWAIEAGSEVDSLISHNQEVETQIKTLERDVQQRRTVHQNLQQQVTQLQRQKREAERQATHEELEIMHEWEASESTLDDLEAEITATSGRIELLHEGNPHAIQNFEKRQRDIDRLTERIANHEADMETWNEQINTIRAQWEPRLDELIKKISEAFTHNFRQIGCLGQVSVYKDEEDFAQWAVHVEVKFRENEQLSLLDSHRQSGGERAVSTIFYLMALQSLTQSPFRVVDEINQGMDPRNERMVHERMVDIACAENKSQYFLITPKLLTGLKYHERMVVHTIYSGETMPEDNAGLDFGKLADLALRVLVK